MQSSDQSQVRPKLVCAAHVAEALDALRPELHAPSDAWRLLTDRYVVDLDAAAALLPTDEPKTQWLTARN